jgi:hypothetical protein
LSRAADRRKLAAMRRAGMPALVFAVVCATHALGITTSYDSIWSIPTARSLLREGNANLDEYRAALESRRFYAIEWIDGHAYSMFPIGASLLALPAVAIVDAVGVRARDSAVEHAVAAIIVALAAVFVYLLGRRSLDVAGALLLAFIFAFCTAAWSTASRALWQHGPSMLMLTLALWLMLGARERPWLVQLAALPLAFAYVIRPTNAIAIAALSAVVLVQHRRYALPYLLWGLVVAVPFLLYALTVHHAWLPRYYAASRVGHTGTFVEALLGTLVSPGRGLFVFSPVFLLSVYGAWRVLRRGGGALLDGALAATIALHWLAVAAFPVWWGGHSFGYRLLSDMVPYLTYFLIPVIAALPGLPRPRRAACTAGFAALVAVSFAINAQGAHVRAVYNWNSLPVNVDEQPSRVWDWRDPQFLRGVRRWAGR